MSRCSIALFRHGRQCLYTGSSEPFSPDHTNEISNLPEIPCGIAVALPQVFGRTIGDEMA